MLRGDIRQASHPRDMPPPDSQAPDRWDPDSLAPRSVARQGVAHAPARDALLPPCAPELDADGHLYVFGYGSLIWKPGFPHDGTHPALLRGFHRRFCLWSRLYRGTPEAPGLVLGLDRGGACRGLAFRVPGVEAPEVLDYRQDRETPNNDAVYERRMLPVSLLDSGGRVVRGQAGLVDGALDEAGRAAGALALARARAYRGA